MFDLKRWVVPHVWNLQAYSSARDEYSGSKGTFLDANENSIGTPGVANNNPAPAGSLLNTPYNRYPDPYQRELKQQIARLKKVDPGKIFLGNGSDEAIDLIIRMFCESGQDEIIITPPTYGMYKVSAGINHTGVVEVPLNEDYQLDKTGILDAVSATTRVLFLCTPNNPTGVELQREDVLEMVQSFPGVVVVDEAYIDFAHTTSLIHELGTFSNLIVMQTFSKAWGMANIRLGAAYASEEIIRLFNKLKPPYNVNGLTQRAAMEVLAHEDQMQEMLLVLKEEKQRLEEALKNIPQVQKILPSSANFVLIRTEEGEALFNYLIQQQVIVRYRPDVVHYKDCLRITVGKKEENDSLLNQIRTFYESNPPYA